MLTYILINIVEIYSKSSSQGKFADCKLPQASHCRRDATLNKEKEYFPFFFLITLPRSSVLKEPFVDSGLTSSAHICALACHTHKHSRRDSTSVIGSLIFASARLQAPRDCEYRYSMTALRANKTDNPPSERRMPFVRRSLFSFFLSHFISFVAHFCSPFISISQCVVRYLVATI